MTENFVNLESARTEEQKLLMKKIMEDGVCPFCKEHFKDYHPKTILRETEHWFFTENISPYVGTKYHFLFVSKPTHISQPSDLSSEAIVDLFALLNKAIDENKILGGSFLMRFGDPKHNGSSVEHLHAHLIVGDVNDPDHEPVRVKLG